MHNFLGLWEDMFKDRDIDYSIVTKQYYSNSYYKLYINVITIVIYKYNIQLLWSMLYKYKAFFLNCMFY